MRCEAAGSSRLPAGTAISSGIAAKRRNACVPQTGQKAWISMLPLSPATSRGGASAVILISARAGMVSQERRGSVNRTVVMTDQEISALVVAARGLRLTSATWHWRKT